MVNMIIRKWNLSGADSTLNNEIADKFLTDAVREVENFDFPSGTDYIVANESVTFPDEPSDDIGLLYVYCALKNIQQAYSQNLMDNSVGITIKSGLESVSTSGASNLYSKIKEDFEKKYQSLLNIMKIRKQTNSTLIDLYDEE